MTLVSDWIIMFFLDNFTYPFATYMLVSFLIGCVIAYKTIILLREYS